MYIQDIYVCVNTHILSLNFVLAVVDGLGGAAVVKMLHQHLNK